MVQVAGRLKHFVQQWYKLTSNQTILDTVKHCHIEFVSDILPYQEIPKRPIKMSLSEQNIMNTEVSKLLNKGVIEQCAHHTEAEFISNVFLKEKKDASYRMILNLKSLNKNVAYHKFKMDTLEFVLLLVKPNCYMASVDLRDAYYSPNCCGT